MGTIITAPEVELVRRSYFTSTPLLKRRSSASTWNRRERATISRCRVSGFLRMRHSRAGTDVIVHALPRRRLPGELAQVSSESFYHDCVGANRYCLAGYGRQVTGSALR